MAKSFNAQMKTRFVKITNDYGKVNIYVHQTAMLIAAHAQEHKDCSTAQGLVMAMPASIRREMLILWFDTFTPIKVKNDPAWVAKMNKEDTKLYVPFDLENGDAMPFFTLAEKEENKEKPPITFDQLIAMVTSLATQIEKKAEDDKMTASAAHAAGSLADALRAIRIARPKLEPVTKYDVLEEEMVLAAAKPALAA